MFLKDLRKLLIQLGAANVRFHTEKKRDRQTILELIKLFKVTSLSIQLAISFISSGNDSEEVNGKVFKNKLNLSKYKHFSDLYIDQLLYLLNFQIYHLYLKPYFNRQDFQQEEQRLLALSSLKFVEFSTFIINLTYQNTHSIRLLE